MMENYGKFLKYKVYVHPTVIICPEIRTIVLWILGSSIKLHPIQTCRSIQFLIDILWSTYPAGITWIEESSIKLHPIQTCRSIQFLFDILSSTFPAGITWIEESSIDPQIHKMDLKTYFMSGDWIQQCPFQYVF